MNFAQDKSCVAEFPGHKYGINCVAFAPNNKYIVSVSRRFSSSYPCHVIVNHFHHHSDVSSACSSNPRIVPSCQDHLLRQAGGDKIIVTLPQSFITMALKISSGSCVISSFCSSGRWLIVSCLFSGWREATQI